MSEKTSNISPIVQNAITKERLSKANSYLDKELDSLEPTHNLDKVEYGKVIVHEYVKKDGVIHIIDNSENGFSVYEILPNGSYEMNSVENGKVSKTNGDSLTIINGDMKLKINDGELSIIVNGGDNPTMERLISFDKLKDLLNNYVTIDKLHNLLSSSLCLDGAPLSYIPVIPSTVTENDICYEKIEINKNA